MDRSREGRCPYCNGPTEYLPGASHAERTVRHYSRIPGYRGEPDYEADVTDLLTDLRHFCAGAGLNFDELCERSRRHYEAERKEQKQ